MPILVQDVVNRCLSALDAEGSDRYLFDQDFNPGINYAINVAIASLNDLFADKKLAPEALIELTRTRVWQTDAYSRFTFNPADLAGEDFWTLITVHPKAICQPQGPVLILPNDVSKVRIDLLYVSSEFSAARRTYEQASINRDNPFSPGNSIITNPSLVTYGVMDSSNYNSANYNTPGTYAYEITPAVPKELIGVRYLIKPTYPTSISDTIQFRETAMNLIVDFTLNWISWKMGDGTNLYQVSAADQARLLSIFGT